MDLTSSAIVLRQRTVSETLDLGVRVLSGLSPWDTTRLALATVIPAWALVAGVRWGLALPWWATWCVAAVVTLFLEGVFTVRFGALLFRESLGVGETLRRFGSRLGAWSAATLLTALALGATALSGFLLTPMAMSRTLFVPEAVLLEGGGGAAALGRASRIAQGQGSSSVPLSLAAWTLRVVAVLFGEAVGRGVLIDLFQLPLELDTLWGEGGSWLGLLGLFASAPYLSAARLLGYLDVRTRADGWDVQLRFARFAAKGRA